MNSEREKPLGLDMPFDEALARFIGTAPAELQKEAGFKKGRRPKPPPKVVEKKARKGPA